MNSTAIFRMGIFRIFAMIGLCASLLTACQKSPEYTKIQGQTMGTSYHISFEAPTSTDISLIQADIDARLLQINKSMSTYDDTATIMAFNRAKAGERIAIDDDFAKVLDDSYIIYQQSQGAFDPTVQPLVLLWGFGKNLTVERLQSPPSDEQITAIKPIIGLDKVHKDGNEIYKDADGVGLDFSAIAKGYGVDVIANTLKSKGIHNYMVEIGGEIATAGVNDKGKPWQIAIDKPTQGSTVQNREILTTVALTDGHMATSGNYRNSLSYNGTSYSHTINPHTAHPVANGVPSVTVLHDSTALADGWATALTAISQDDAIALAENANIRALFVIEQDKTWQIHYSSAMQTYLKLATNDQ